MDTDDPKNDPSQSQPNVSDSAQDTGNDQNLVDLVDALDSVDTLLKQRKILSSRGGEN